MGWGNIGKALGVSAVLPSLGLSAMDSVTGMAQAKYESDQQSKLNREAFGMQRAENLAAFERNKSWDLEKYGMEKADSLARWNMQNEYNTPAAQMSRMKEAGLNPALMYGQATTGNAAVINSPSVDDSNIDAASINPAEYRMPRQDPSEKLGKYFQIKNMGLESQNLAANNSILHSRGRQAAAEADIAENDRDILKASNTYSRDDYKLRLGGRIGDWFRRKFEGKTFDDSTKWNKVDDIKLFVE